MSATRPTEAHRHVVTATVSVAGRVAGIAGATRLAALAVALVAAASLALLGAEPAAAQGPPASEAQAQSIERQLMCPQCPNERLDTCERTVCRDMKRIIRERLEAGATPDDIILFFESRYGPKVRAELAREGFNLLLFGWVGGSIVAMGLGATWYLWSLRRHARRPAPERAPDDRWLDEQLASEEPDARA